MISPERPGMAESDANRIGEIICKTGKSCFLFKLTAFERMGKPLFEVDEVAPFRH
jgi:hypothetical protein